MNPFVQIIYTLLLSSHILQNDYPLYRVSEISKVFYLTRVSHVLILLKTHPTKSSKFVRPCKISHFITEKSFSYYNMCQKFLIRLDPRPLKQSNIQNWHVLKIVVGFSVFPDTLQFLSHRLTSLFQKSSRLSEPTWNSPTPVIVVSSFVFDW